MRFRTDAGRVLVEDVDWRVVPRDDPEYPGLLEHLPDPPERLWVIGRSLSSLPPCVAVVGTRAPTGYGQEIAHALASELARSGMCVVSGMARGIDAWAHIGALTEGGTVAVLAGGIDVCYPSSNRELYEQIAERGAIIAEHPPGTPTHKRRFTHRNRIIAALSLCTVVVQAAERSGALATARHAMDIGREVLAVPGDVRVDVSAGTHELLRDGAGVCTCAGDVLERVGVEMVRDAATRRLGPIPADMPEEQSRILTLLGGDSMSAESIGVAADLAGALLVRVLGRLELAGWIGRGPGGRILRVR